MRFPHFPSIHQLPWRTITKEAFDKTFPIINFFCCLHLTNTYICTPVLTTGPSMVPTLHLTGDLVLVQRFSTKITCGDIVLVRSPENPRKIVAKRVTGMEGDEITFLVDPKKDDGKVKTVKVEQGHVWVTGDNVYDSRDSRTFGAVPSGLLYGRVFFRVWPFNAFGSLGSNNL